MANDPERKSLLPEVAWEPPGIPVDGRQTEDASAGDPQIPQPPAGVDFENAIAETSASIQKGDQRTLYGRILNKSGITTESQLIPPGNTNTVDDVFVGPAYDRSKNMRAEMSQDQQDRINIHRARQAGDEADAQAIIGQRKQRESEPEMTDEQIAARHSAGQWDDSAAFPTLPGSDTEARQDPFVVPEREGDTQPQKGPRPQLASRHSAGGDQPASVPKPPLEFPEREGDIPPMTGPRPQSVGTDDARTLGAPWEMPGSPGGGGDSSGKVVEVLGQILTTLKSIESKLDLEARWP